MQAKMQPGTGGLPNPFGAASCALFEPAGMDYLFSRMQTFHAETVIEKDGKLQLAHVPFAEGEPVPVFTSSARPGRRDSLKGSVLKYEQPLEPIAGEYWEAAK